MGGGGEEPGRDTLLLVRQVQFQTFPGKKKILRQPCKIWVGYTFFQGQVGRAPDAPWIRPLHTATPTPIHDAYVALQNVATHRTPVLHVVHVAYPFDLVILVTRTIDSCPQREHGESNAPIDAEVCFMVRASRVVFPAQAASRWTTRDAFTVKQPQIMFRDAWEYL